MSTTMQCEELVIDINRDFLNNFKDPDKTVNILMNIILKEFSVLVLGSKKGKKYPTFNEFISNNMYCEISNYANIVDYDNCIKCLLMNEVRIKTTQNHDIKREIRSVNNLLACLATYCKDCPEEVKPKDFL